MDCTTYLDRIAAHADGALPRDEEDAALSHVACCSPCSAKYRWERAAKKAIKARLPVLEPGPFLRQRVRACLDEQTNRRGLWGLPSPIHVLAAAAVVVLLILPLYAIRPRSVEAPNLLSAIAASYGEVTGGRPEKASSLSPSATLLDLSPWGYRLLAQGMNTVEGRPARVFVYQGADQDFLVAQEFDGSNFPLPERARVVTDGANFYAYERDGVNVVAWQEEGLLCAIASLRPQSDLVSLAKQVVMRG